MLLLIESVVGYAGFYIAWHDFSELSLILLDVVGKGEKKLFCVLRSHHYAAYNRSLGHSRGCEDKIDEELVGTMTDHREVGVFAVGNFRTELNLKLIFFIFHFMSVCK